MTCLAGGSGRLVSAHSLALVVTSLEADVGELLVDGNPVIVETRRLQDDPRRADHHRHREDPEKQPIQDHRHVLPILFGLKMERVKLLSLGSKMKIDHWVIKTVLAQGRVE